MAHKLRAHLSGATKLESFLIRAFAFSAAKVIRSGNSRDISEKITRLTCGFQWIQH